MLMAEPESRMSSLIEGAMSRARQEVEGFESLRAGQPDPASAEAKAVRGCSAAPDLKSGCSPRIPASLRLPSPQPAPPPNLMTLSFLDRFGPEVRVVTNELTEGAGTIRRVVVDRPHESGARVSVFDLVGDGRTGVPSLAVDGTRLGAVTSEIAQIVADTSRIWIRE